MKIEGIIVAGLGIAKYWVGKVNEILDKKTGIKMFLGTLNVKLDTEFLVDPDFIIKKEEYGGTENVLVKKCKVFSKEAFIVRAEKNQNGTGEHSLNIIEIVSDINFRNTYNLNNNDKVEIEI